MRLLRVGSVGDDVSKVQAALNAIYVDQLVVDGKFGAATEDMVLSFQSDNDLTDDGIVGPSTWDKLFRGEVQDTGEEEPTGVIYQSQLSQLFGKPKDPSPYLKVMDFAEFKKDFAHVKDYTGKVWSCRVWGHQLMETPLNKAFRLLISRGLAKELHTFDGCVSVRPMTGGGGMSVHSWGLAIDFNAGTNPYGHRPVLTASFVKCFTEVGFEWGGGWRTPDGMHFQLPRTSG